MLHYLIVEMYGPRHKLHFQQNFMSAITFGGSGQRMSLSFATRICPLEMIRLNDL